MTVPIMSTVRKKSIKFTYVTVRAAPRLPQCPASTDGSSSWSSTGRRSWTRPTCTSYSMKASLYCRLCSRLRAVERLNCKRPIQCLASSEILTPHPLTARRVCTPFLWWGERGHTRWVERGWGVNSWEDARHCSVLYKCNYFVF
jgi:hypothetical protein